MTKRTPERLNWLLKVLNLLADALELGFARDHVLRNMSVVCLGSKRVQLTENLLGDEFEGSADRLVPAEMMGKLGEMTLKPGQLFGDVGAIGKK